MDEAMDRQGLRQDSVDSPLLMALNVPAVGASG
jgi:hypothetical protein